MNKTQRERILQVNFSSHCKLSQTGSFYLLVFVKLLELRNFPEAVASAVAQ